MCIPGTWYTAVPRTTSSAPDTSIRIYEYEDVIPGPGTRCKSAPPLIIMPACFSGNPGKKNSQFRKFSSSIITALIRTRIPKKSPASVFHFLHLAFWFDPGCWGQKQQLDVVATTTAAVLLLLCCWKTLHYLIALPLQAFQHVKYLRVTRS